MDRINDYYKSMKHLVRQGARPDWKDVAETILDDATDFAAAQAAEIAAQATELSELKTVVETLRAQKAAAIAAEAESPQE